MSLPSLEPYGSSTRSPYPGNTGSDEERWHVRLASDDVKFMTVDQLDDAYRLSIVDLETEVWKPGMRHWQPLGIVLGEDEDVDREPTFVGPGPQDRTPRMPPPVALVSPGTGSLVPPPRRSAPPPPRLVPTHPPVPAVDARSLVPTVPAPAPPSRHPAPDTVRSDYPPSVAGYAAPSASLSTRPTAPPLALSVAPTRPAPKRSAFGNALLGAAFLAGTCVSLYRNDVLLDAARRLSLESRYTALETRFLGGPSFGMIRALTAEPPLPALALAAASRASMPPAAAPATAAPTETSPAVAVPAETAPAITAPVETPLAVAKAPAASPPTPTSTTSAAARSPALATRRATPAPVAKRAAPASVPAHRAVESTTAVGGRATSRALDPAVARTLRQRKEKANGSEFDPLNPNL